LSTGKREEAATLKTFEANAGMDKKENLEKDKIVHQFAQIEKDLSKYKDKVSKLTINNMKQDIAEEALESKWNELNLGID